MHDSACGEPASELGAMASRTAASIMTHVLALAWLFSYVFSSGQWLHIGWVYGTGGCVNCRGTGWVLCLIAFILLLVRWIMFMLTAVSFSAKTRKTAFIIDVVITILVLIAFALTMTTVHQRYGDSYVDSFYLTGDLLWALIALVASLILDYTDLRLRH